jgi:hypothetical protein
MRKFKQRRITAYKREIKDFTKLPSATSFIRQPLSEIVDFGRLKRKFKKAESS